MVMTNTGAYGTDYLWRALVTAVGLGANLGKDAVYPFSESDKTGQKYSGKNHYVMHFAKGELPPVRGFWLVTMYNKELFFVKNPINRYSVSPRDHLKTNADGSTERLAPRLGLSALTRPDAGHRSMIPPMDDHPPFTAVHAPWAVSSANTVLPLGLAIGDPEIDAPQFVYCQLPAWGRLKKPTEPKGVVFMRAKTFIDPS
jgi:Protein of unknown function (DUF1214)